MDGHISLRTAYSPRLFIYCQKNELELYDAILYGPSDAYVLDDQHLTYSKPSKKVFIYTLFCFIERPSKRAHRGAQRSQQLTCCS